MLGRGGAGPGEYRMLQQLLAVGGDTLIAFITDPDGYKIELIQRDA